MSHFPEQREISPTILKRLDDISMTESERRAAVVSLQRAERIADFLLLIARLVHRIHAAMVHVLAAGSRRLTAWAAHRRRDRAMSRKRRSPARRPGTT